jgi:hypothetical protein
LHAGTDPDRVKALRTEVLAPLAALGPGFAYQRRLAARFGVFIGSSSGDDSPEFPSTGIP